MNGEGIAKEDNAVSGEIVDGSSTFVEGTYDKDDSVVSEQDSISTVSGENPDETQKDNFAANGETSDASAAIENLGEEKSEVNNESLAPAQETSGKDSHIISEQDDLLAANNENPNEAHENDSTARGETDSTLYLRKI